MTRADNPNRNETMTTAQQFSADCLSKFQLARELGVNDGMVKDLNGLLIISVKSNGLIVQFAADQNGDWFAGLACTIYQGSRPHCFSERSAPDAHLAYLCLCGKKPSAV
jgi:hypothetical protein